MGGESNRVAYDGIEQISSFASEEALRGYRRARIAKYKAAVEFMSLRSPAATAVLEVGSGSSALLYALAQAGCLREGLGIELSRSRHEFAERWKRDEGETRVTNVNGSFDEVEMASSRWDWFAVIDNTFTYLYPEDASYPAQLLGKAFKTLNREGRVLLDVINYAKRVPGVDYRQWAQFADTDPYAFGLYSSRVENGINSDESIFIKRDGSQWRKREQSKVYSLTELTSLLESCGFVVDEVFGNLAEQPYAALESDRLVVVAGKQR